MTRTEHKDEIISLRQQLSHLESIGPRCKSCEHFVAAKGHCKRWNSPVPGDVQATGCEEWLYDNIPF